jgi:hypothetical protein
MRLRRSGEAKAQLAARRHADYMLWHDGYPASILGDSPDGPDGAVIVEKQGADWVVYRKRGGERGSLQHHEDVGRAYEDALQRIYDICAAEGL